MSMQDPEIGRLQRRLAGRRQLARLALLFERLWPALWPPFGVAGLFVCLALLGVPALLPPLAHVVLLAASGLAVVVLLVRGLRGLALPDNGAADRRLERASGLRHRPLAVLADTPTATDESGLALWRAHVARAVSQLRRIRVGFPHPGLARRDRRALRGGLAVGLVACLGIAGADAPTRLLAALTPTLPAVSTTPSTQLQAWITPPEYTRIPPIFLRTTQHSLAVPAGSHLTVSVTGGSGTPSLALDGRSTPFRTLDKASYQADRDLTAGGRLAIYRSGSELASWDLTVIAEQPPTAAWTEPPGPAAADPQRLRLPWRAADEYGVTSLQVEMHLRDRRDASPLMLSIALPADAPKSAHGVDEQDLTANPWAGLPVVARLVARNAPGLTGRSGEALFVLPERPFHNPIARALIAIRKGLSLHPNNRDAAVDGLDQLLMQRQAFGEDFGAYLNLAGIYYLLEHDPTAAAVPRAQGRMWELALHMEEGSLDRTARALERARAAAQNALQKAIQNPSEANRQALEQKLRALEEAIQKRMEALAQQLQRNGQVSPYEQGLRQLSSRDMQRLAEAARKAAQQGDMQTAEQRMAELEQMLDALRNARPMTAQQMRRMQQMQRGRQQMGALQDMLQRQGGLLDHAQAREQGAAPQAADLPQGLEQQPNGAQPGRQQPDAARQRAADQAVQRALRRALGEMMQDFGDLTGKIPPSLGQADQDMQGAEQALGQGQDRAASRAERRAIADLQKGGQQMGQQMAQQFGNGQAGTEPGEMGLSLQNGPGGGPGAGAMPGQAGRRDPLGRPYGEGENGADESNDVTVPDQAARQRAQEIEELLRERGAQRTRPQEELDYINRLLKQF